MLEAKQLHDLRVQAAVQLTDAIHEELKDLYLEKKLVFMLMYS